ncbi:MAG: hypothetical protein RIR62_98 [Pseudomonadota bacterium]
MQVRNRIVGLVRFSYPALTGFVRQDGDPDANVAALHARDRLEARFALFERFALPSLLAQSDGRFETLFLVGEGFPRWAMDRLSDLTAPLRGARIVALPPMQHYPATQAAFGMLPDDGCTHLTGFRLDDDDAMDIHHIARLRRMAEGMLRAVDAAKPFCIGHNRGLFLDLSQPRGPVWRTVVEKLPIGIGLAMCAPVERRENIFRRNHRLLSMYYTVLTDADHIAFVRTIHDGNDSEAKASGQSAEMAPLDLGPVLRQGFPFLTPPPETAG